MARLLVVDDEPSFRALLRDILEGAGHGVTEARDGAEALAFLERTAFDLVLTDRRMPAVDGLELLRRIRARTSPPPVVVLTAHGSIPEAVEAVRLGAADYIAKPLPSPEALVDLVASLLPREDDGEIVTADPAMKELLDLVDRVAPRDVAVLVTGESGAGKELVARRLHARSPRANGPFVAVNAAALPETLAESELFGAERGAFTGADQARAGRFEEASGGTLFLDEVGELPLALQSKLLRVLEERVVRRLGGSRDLPVDVRLVAATNRDLTRETEEGGFRQDLFFRLAVVVVNVPPLRERPDDVPLLARHFAERLAERHGVPVPSLTDDALAALSAHAWPGNVRELRNVLERSVVVRGGAPIRTADLGLAPAAAPLDRAHREREALLAALRRTRGKREEAARLLGISVRTLYYRLKQWGIG
ncbi:MAG: sigma-54-dependent Fis family transcriptional regulator [Thermoanaerobaculia bacterium]|nr:sigma-54-dependent Fis family transcriptional regulator [Thermoanaerobaculia bacterium]